MSGLCCSRSFGIQSSKQVEAGRGNMDSPHLARAWSVAQIWPEGSLVGSANNSVGAKIYEGYLQLLFFVGGMSRPLPKGLVGFCWIHGIYPGS